MLSYMEAEKINLLTKHIQLSDKLSDCNDRLNEIAEAMRNSAVVAFPTETVYGLGALWNDPKAITEVFRVKGRPMDNPLIIHVSSVEQMKTYFSCWDEVAEILTDAFCPGPFTLIMKKSENVDTPATAGLDTVGVRIPSHPVARALLSALNDGIAAPSANLSGRPSPTTFADCIEDLDGKVPYIIDGGEAEVGLESTIVSWGDGHLRLLRPGGISAEQIQECLDMHNCSVVLECIPLQTMLKEGERPPAPGMKYRHYSPKASVHIFPFSSNVGVASYIGQVQQQLEVERAKVSAFKAGFYISQTLADYIEAFFCESFSDAEILVFENDDGHKNAASGLFSAFRELDRRGCSDIWVEEQNTENLGAAFMNRLYKASGLGSELLPKFEE